MDRTMTSDDGRYLPIGDYAFLSDCHSTALVSRAGSIDWACLRRFDRSSAFARILDHDCGGYFSIAPRQPLESASRRYLPDTMVLESTFTTADGTIVVTDAFAMRAGGADGPLGQLLRSVECRRGSMTVDIVVAPRFDYGQTRPWLRRHDTTRSSAIGGDDALLLVSDVELIVDDELCALTGSTSMAAGDRFGVTVSSQPAYSLDLDADLGDLPALLDQTVQWWQRWSSATLVDGPHAELVARSALVLKSLCCAPTGAIIAAPTTSLPEVVGGDANWDYRYCWIRDATLALEALESVGHGEVADGLRRFIMRSAAGDGGELQIMFGPYGQRRLSEEQLDLEGWRGSKPVRIGNAASTQVQLDVYGHLLDAVHLWQERRHDIDDDEWRFLATVVDRAVDRWEQPDAGIWEMRTTPSHFVHSKVMAWVALDRGIRLVTHHGLDDVDLDRWRSIRDDIRRSVERRGVDPERGNFVQHFGTREVDASLLKLALVGFVDANDERMLATVAAIEHDLTADNGLLRRYRSTDGTVDGTREGVFLLCSFWLVEVLVLQDRRDDASALFERVIAVANDLGLLAEQCEVSSGQLLGNFPQAFTHLGLIAADRRLRARPDPAV